RLLRERTAIRPARRDRVAPQRLGLRVGGVGEQVQARVLEVAGDVDAYLDAPELASRVAHLVRLALHQAAGLPERPHFARLGPAPERPTGLRHQRATYRTSRRPPLPVPANRHQSWFVWPTRRSSASFTLQPFVIFPLRRGPGLSPAFRARQSAA